jgi:hypothetical protein
MITLKEFMEIVDYKVTEGSDYCWSCYGGHAYRLDSWNQDHEGHSVSIVFDTRTHVVYEASAYDYSRNRAYRLINSQFKDAHAEEALSRGVLEDQAWDEVNYVDLDVDDDFIQKALSIVADEDYDTRVSIPLDLPDDVLFELMKQAHEQDITLNQLIEDVLRNMIAVHETGTDNPIDFPVNSNKKSAVAAMSAKKKKSKKKSNV